MTEPPLPPAVSLRGLTKRYRERVAVEDLTIDVPAGVVAGFVGPNGAGKTTTLAMLLGLVAPTAGSGTVLGEPLGDPAAYLGAVGALIEGPAFYPGLSGAQNLAVLATAAVMTRRRSPACSTASGCVRGRRTASAATRSG